MSLRAAIRKTLDYARRYDSELTSSDVFGRLLSRSIYIQKEVEEELKLIQTTNVNSHQHFFDLKMQKAIALARTVGKLFDSILFVGVTGSVAAGYPKEDDDIDLLIITKNNHLWLNRLLVRIYIRMKAIPHRTYGNKQRKDDFCFNLWLDESSLKLPLGKQNKKNAIDLVLMKPIYNRHYTYEKLLQANDWASKYVATPYNSIISKSEFLISNKVRESRTDDWSMSWAINLLLFWPQWIWMRAKISNEVVDRHRAFFHKS